MNLSTHNQTLINSLNRKDFITGFILGVGIGCGIKAINLLFSFNLGIQKITPIKNKKRIQAQYIDKVPPIDKQVVVVGMPNNDIFIGKKITSDDKVEDPKKENLENFEGFSQVIILRDPISRPN